MAPDRKHLGTGDRDRLFLSPVKGTYVLVMRIRRPARLRHHLRPARKPRWHIDYLSNRAVVHQVWTCPGEDRVECAWAGVLSGRHPEAVRGFGSSDCDCSTHLFHSRAIPAPVPATEGRRIRIFGGREIR